MSSSVDDTCSITKHWLGWDEVFLPQVADWLLQHAAQRTSPEAPPGAIWLRDLICVLPGSRAIRRLSELLALRCAAEDVSGLVPPRCILVGSLPEVLSGTCVPYLSSFELEQIWSDVLTNSPALWSAITPHQNEPQGVAAELVGLWDTLGREGYTFSSARDQLKRSEHVSFEDSRWNVLAELEECFRGRITQQGLFERTLHRLALLRDEQFDCIGKEIVMVGAVDLGRLHQRFLALAPVHTHLLLPMPEEHAEGVGEFGELIPQYWKHVHQSVGLHGADLRSVDDPEREAASVALEVSKLSESHALQDITISVAEETHVELLSQHLSACQIPHHSFAATASHYRSFASFMLRAGQFIETGSFHGFVELSCSDWAKGVLNLDLTDELLQKLEVVEEQQCPFRMFPFHQFQLPRLSDELLPLLQIGDRFFGSFQEPCTPSVFLQTLTEHIFEEQFTGDQREVFHDVVQQFLVHSDQVAQSGEFRYPAHRLFRLLGEVALQRGVGGGHGSEAVGVELLGWLETLFDDGKVLCITGFHDGVVPGIQKEGKWLPGQVRQELGLDSEARKFARDYFFCLHALSSRVHTVFLCPRKGMKGDFFRPSRLVWGGKRDDILRQARTFFIDAPYAQRVKLFGEEFGKQEPWSLENPLPAQFDKPESLSVTSFRDYLHCPFRFYLKHILKLSTVHPQQEELNALTFGTLFHDVVARFAVSDQRDSTDAAEIAEFLSVELQRYSTSLLGGISKPAVEVQLLNLEERLRAFAELQAEWRSEGWKILHAELPFSEGESPVVQLNHNAGSTILRGRIDRIDFHEEQSRWVAFDYKTTARKWRPEQTHQREDDWVDLQLPLYHFALQQLGYSGQIEVGYIVVPTKSEESEFVLAEWDAEALTSSLEAARYVAEQVAAGAFWPPTEEIAAYDDFADLLGEGQYSALIEEGEFGGGEG